MAITLYAGGPVKTMVNPRLVHCVFGVGLRRLKAGLNLFPVSFLR